MDILRPPGAALLLCAGLAWCGGEPPVRYVNAFLDNGGGARSAALGDALAADPADRAAAFGNPAGMTGVNAFSVTLSHASLFGGLTTNDFAAAIYPLGAGHVVGGYLLRSAVDDIQDTRGFDVDSRGMPVFDSGKLKWTDNVDYAMGAAYARGFGPRLNAGGVATLIRRRLGDRILYGAGINGGANYRFGNGVLLGILAKNITTTINRYAGLEYEVALPELYPGVGYLGTFEYVYGTFEALYQFDNILSTAGVSQGTAGGIFQSDGQAPGETGLFKNPASFFLNGRLGLEYIFKNRLFLRLGTNATHLFTAGAGVRLFRLRVDFAFRSHTDINGSYRLAAAWDI